MRAGTIQNVNGAGIGVAVTSVNGKAGPVTVAASAGVTSIDGDTGPAVDLTDNYVPLSALATTLAGASITASVGISTPIVIATGSVRVGSSPATSGDVRMTNLGQLTFRAASGLSDVLMFQGDANNNTVSGTNLIPSGDGSRSLGLTTNRWSSVHSIGAQINANGTPGAVERFRVNNPTTTDALACAIISSDGFTRRPLVIQGAGSQTGELLHGQDSTGAQMFAFLSNGHLVSPTLRVGTTPATSGLVRLPSGSGLTSRNNANTADLNLLFCNASDQAVLPDTVPGADNTRTLGASGARWASIFGVALSLGTNPASAGSVKLQNGTFVRARNSTNAGDIDLLSTSTNQVVLGGTGQSGITIGTTAGGTGTVAFNTAGGGASCFVVGAGLTLVDGFNAILGSTTGTKWGTATTQKQGWWNATPVVQPTTAIVGAAITANAGTAVNDASTFAGYTIGQVVAALRLIGILA